MLHSIGQKNAFGFHRIPFNLESESGSGPYYRIYSKTLTYTEVIGWVLLMHISALILTNHCMMIM